MSVVTNYPMRALSKCGNFLVPFTLADGPAPIDKDHFILTEKQNSPILRYDSVLKGSDIEGLYEGDIVTIEGDDKEYPVIYATGVRLKDSEEQIEIIYDNQKKFSIVSDIYTRKMKFIKRTIPKFRIDNTGFLLSDLYGMHKGHLLLNKTSVMVKPEDIRMHAGVRDKNRKYLYFGDHGLTLLNGQPGVYQDGEFITLASGKLDI